MTSVPRPRTVAGSRCRSAVGARSAATARAAATVRAAVTAGVLGAVAVLFAAGCGPPPGVDGETTPWATTSTAPTSGPAPPGGSRAPTVPPGGSGPGAPGAEGTGPTTGPGNGRHPTSSPSADPEGYPEQIAVSCAGYLPADDVLRLLRRQHVLPDDHDASLTDGPYCSEDWHYSQVTMPGRDPLQVVTRGSPDQLALVTAGTDVCTVEVRVRAPTGIRTTAACLD